MSICFNNSLVNIYTFNENNASLFLVYVYHSFLFDIMDSKVYFKVLSDNWGNTSTKLMLYGMKNLRILRKLFPLVFVYCCIYLYATHRCRKVIANRVYAIFAFNARNFRRIKCFTLYCHCLLYMPDSCF